MMESLKGLDLSPSNSETPEAAEAAVKTFNGKELVEGMLLYLERDKKKAERQQELKRKSEALKVLKSKRLNRFQGLNLYVKNLDDTIDDERLRKEFSPFGTITSAKVIMEEGRSKGFGFVCFSSPEEAIKAVTEMNGRIVGTEPLYVALAQRKEDRKARLASQYMQLLYVKHLDNTIDNERLRKEFSPFGTITSAKVIMEEGRSKGFGFVCFSSPEEAAKAVTEMNGKIVGKKPLYVALAQRKEDRKAHLTSQYMQRMANIRMQQIGRYMQPGAQSGYFVPTSPAPPQSFHRVTRAASIRSSPRWSTQAQVRLGAQGAAAAHSNMQQNAYRAATRPPNQSAAMRNNISNMPKNITKVQPKA